MRVARPTRTSDAMQTFSSRDGWLPIALAPDDCDLELGKIRNAGIEALRFPCRRIEPAQVRGRFPGLKGPRAR
jgi:hypothetical protein